MNIVSKCLHLMFSTANVPDKWNVRGFERMLSYEQYPEKNSHLWLSSFKKQLINLRGQLDVNTNIYFKSCAYHPDFECCTLFHGNLSNSKSSEDTLFYLYVIWNMLKSADLHETILTPVICHKHVRYDDDVTLYFSVSTKTWNDLKPPTTIYNHLQPPQNHLQPLANYLKPSKTKHKCLK